MYLKSIEMVGFKSFAKKSQLSFTTPVTGIVGPNGSGKSNVTEGFRFVLGEQSMKTMRSKKTEDLIFNGSDKVSRSNRASVKLVFDNRKKIFDIDYEEVILERIVHRDSSSEYLLNGSSVRLKDITELLANAHIGASGHHIISQGETDRILNVTPKERKAMLEDALGLKVFQHKKREAERKLEKVEENIKEAETLRREIKPHLRFLQKQVEKIEKAHEMRVELVGLYKEYFAEEATHIEVLARKIDAELPPIESQIHEAIQKRDHAATRVGELKNSVGEHPELARLEQERREVRTDKDELSRSIGNIEGQIRSLESLQNQKQKDVPADHAQAIHHEVAEHIEMALQSEDIGQIKGALESIKSAMGRLFGAGRPAEDSGLAAKIVPLHEERAQLENSMTALVAREESIEDAIREIQDTATREQTDLRDAERAVFEMKEALNVLERDKERLMRDQETLRRDRTAYDEERQEASVLVGEEALRFEQVPAVSVSREDQEARRKVIERIKIRLEDSGAASGEDIMHEFRQVEERDQFLEREITDLEKSATSLNELIAELETELYESFEKGVTKVNKEFQELFAIMFGGGTARLELVKEVKKGEDEIDLGDEETEIEEGVEIAISLPRKKIRGLQMLSGGERALTSIALLFALSQVNPPPFLILDETDAALDEANSRRYGDMIERLSQHSQLIVVTHNRETMSRAGVLYGVTMGGDGASQLLSVAFEEAVKVAK